MLYLGHKITPEGLKIDESKVKTVVEWPISKMIREVKSFLGFTVFFRKSIEDYAKVAAPLNNLTKGRVNKKKERGQPSPPVVWNDELNQCFEKLKQRVASAPAL